MDIVRTFAKPPSATSMRLRVHVWDTSYGTPCIWFDDLATHEAGAQEGPAAPPWGPPDRRQPR